MKRFCIGLLALGACASTAAAQPKEAAPSRQAGPAPRAATPAPLRPAALRYAAPSNTPASRAPSPTSPYAGDRGYGRGRIQGYPQGSYGPAPQAVQAAPNLGYARGGYTRGGYDARSSGPRSPNVYGDRPYDARTGGGGVARGYGESQRYRPHYAPYRYPSGYGYRAFHRGEGFPRALLISDYILFDYTAFDLPPPPRSTYEWVRYGPDAVLVDTYSGQIVDVDYGVFAGPPAGYADAGGGDTSGYAAPPSYPPQKGDRYDPQAYPYGAPSDPRDGAYPPDGD